REHVRRGEVRMTRRLRIAGTAFGAMLVPACAGFAPDPPTIKPVNPPIPTAAGYRPAPTVVAAQPARPKIVEPFAAERPSPLPTLAHVPTPLADTPAHAEITPVATRPRDVLSAPMDPPRLSLPALSSMPMSAPAEPVPDAEGIIRGPWPTIRGLSNSKSLAPTKSEPRAFASVSDHPPPLI